MELREVIRHLRALDRLVVLERTGPLSQLAERMGLPHTVVERLLSLMKNLGAPVCFSAERDTYFYEYPGELSIGFTPEPKARVIAMDNL